MVNIRNKGVVIIDFGSQYTKLIARRIRENMVFSEILSPTSDMHTIMKNAPAAIILSGGPNSVNDNTLFSCNKLIFELNIPILGICYGLQLMVKNHGGEIDSESSGEYGLAIMNIKDENILFSGCKNTSKVWMSHGDKAIMVPEKWKLLAVSSNGVIAAISNKDNNRFATQFHPEVSHTENGKTIIRNFLFKIARCSPRWTPANFIIEKIQAIKKIVGDKQVLVGVSGGVDSSVVAALIKKAVGNKMIAVLIDHGLMRKDEAKECENFLKEGLDLEINVFDESDIFFSKLKGLKDPEKKRKVIGAQFIESFDRVSEKFNDITFLAQGTLYPDVIESGVSDSKTANVIKSHHNVGGLPKEMNFQLIEPLRDLFKDEVRNIGFELGLNDLLISRHPFPGPGLSVRIIGEITPQRVNILQESDKIYIDILHEENLYNDIWQAFAILVPIKTVGVMGDKRTYENLIALRAVTSEDGMTADWFKMPNQTLQKVSTKIINNVEGVNRVVYDITSKPPGTIEWE
tara:strand:+ start:395 stop:1945 length:1551 start_codon:yes stop_codon:yes gene_type:complete